MNRRYIASLLGTLALALGQSAQAATLSLQPSAPLVGDGSPFTVDMLFSAADAPGAHPGLYGGQIVLDFDPSLLVYDGFSLASGVTFFSSPVVDSAGGRQTITLGFENATDVGTVGTFSFSAIGEPGSIATLNIADADDFFGTFVTYVPTYQPFYPDFVGTSVEIVPLPGTAWLIITAFGAVMARARRDTRARRAGR